MELVSRRDAISRGLVRYFTGKKCKNGHVAERLVSKQACVECIRIQKRRARENQSIQLYSSTLRRSAKHRAKLRNVDFNLTHEWVRNKIEKGVCEVTGLSITLPDGKGANGPTCFSPSLDRITPQEGYTMTNTRLVVFSYNGAKSDGTDEDVLVMARALVEKYGR